MNERGQTRLFAVLVVLCGLLILVGIGLAATTATEDSGTAQTDIEFSTFESGALDAPSPGLTAAAQSNNDNDDVEWPVRINFQPDGDTPDGFVADTGEAFGDRNGLRYGWEFEHDETVDREDGDYDILNNTLNHFGTPGEEYDSSDDPYWTVELPNGTYDVTLGAGDADNLDNNLTFQVEDTLFLDEEFDDGDRDSNFVVHRGTVEVTEDNLTIEPPDGTYNPKINWLEVWPAGPDCSEVTYAGEGSETAPYEVSNVTQLQCIGHDDSETNLDDDFVLTDDIDAGDAQYWNEGAGFEPIGNETNPFEGVLNGTFEGTEYVISNLTIDRPTEDEVGLFGVTGETAQLELLALEDVNVTGSSAVGALAGNNQGNVNESYATGDVYGDSSGGLVGTNAESATVVDSYATANVTGDGSGGLVGTNSANAENGEIIRSYAVGNVTGEDSGGLVGTNDGQIDDSYWDVDATGQDESAGDATGLRTPQMLGEAAEEYMFEFGATWDVVDDDLVSYPFLHSNKQEPEPGIRDRLFADGVGTVDEPWEIEDWEHLDNVRKAPSANFTLIGDLDSETPGYSDVVNTAGGFEPIGTVDDPFTGTFNGTSDAGDHAISDLTIDRGDEDDVGLFGVTGADATIERLGLEAVDISGETSVGALVGNNSGEIYESYATGEVTGTVAVGGLAGNNTGSGAIFDSYTTANVTGNSELGGFVGNNTGEVTSAYAAGVVDEDDVGDVVGGFFGSHDGDVFEAYWDRNETGQDDGIGHDEHGDEGSNVVGLETDEMLGDAAEDNMFEFGNTWTVKTGDTLSYPYLLNNTQEPAPGQQDIEFAGGDGTEDSPYEIEDWEHLDNVRAVPGANFTLVADLHNETGGYGDVVDTDDGFEPIGTVEDPFTGSFNGTSEYAISDLIINRSTETDVGLFGVTSEDALLERVGLENVTIAGDTSVGALVGNNTGYVNESYVTGDVEGESGVGGLVGTNVAGGLVTDSYSLVDVTGAESGGLVGTNEADATVSDSYAAGTVAVGDTGDEAHLGGLIGTNDGDVTVSYWDIAATGQDEATGDGTAADATGLYTPEMLGDAAEDNMDFDFENTWAVLTEDDGDDEKVSYPYLLNNTQEPKPGEQDPLFAGGYGTVEAPFEIATWDHLDNVRTAPRANFTLISDLENYSEFDDSEDGFEPIGTAETPFTGTFNGTDHAISDLILNRSTESEVGLFGATGEDALLERVGLENATVIGEESVGALVGNNTGEVVESYATGDVYGDNAGGLVGTNAETATVVDSYATANVTGAESGGLVGTNSANAESGEITRSYAVGNVTGEDSGGLVGTNEGDVTDSYWDIAATGQEEATGSGTGDVENVEGLDTPQMLGDAAESNMFEFGATWDVLTEDEGEKVSYPFLQNNTQEPAPGEQDPLFAGGDGTEGTPYEIATWDHLDNVRTAPGANFTLVADLTEGDDEHIANFAPIGDDESPFTGAFDGNSNDHFISDLRIDREDESAVGLFGVLDEQAVVESVDLRDVDIVGDEDVGSLAGINQGTILNASATGTVVGNESVGGLLGTSDGEMNESRAAVDVTGDSAVGGLVGVNEGQLEESFATGDVEGDVDSEGESTDIGGLVGINTLDGTIIDSYSTGDVTGDIDVGGLAGSNIGEVFTSYAIGAVSGDETGGLAGTSSDGDFTDSYWDVQTTGQDEATSEGGEVDGATGLDTPLMLGDPAREHMNLDFTNTWDVFDEDKVSYPFLQNNTQEPHPELRVRPFADGNGTAEDPFQIETWEHLDNVRTAPGANFTLVADLGAEDGDYIANFAPIGDDESPFTGTFDGNSSDHVISGLRIDREDESAVGLFGVLDEGAVVESVNLTGVDIVGDDNVGSLAGVNRGTILNASAAGTVVGNESVGGLLGTSEGEMDESRADVDVTGGVDVGGLVGVNEGHLEESFATGDVEGDVDGEDESIDIGGLAGTNDGTIEDSYATGNVTGDESVGGFIGSNEGEVIDAYAVGNVTGDEAVGGFIGYHDGTLTDTYWDVVTTTQSVGVGESGEDAQNEPTGLETPDMLGDLAKDNMDLDFTNTWAVVGDDDEDDQVSYPFLQNNTQVPPPGEQDPLFAGGNGTAEAPFQIENWEHLDNVREAPSAYFTLVADLSMGDEDHIANFDPIGDEENPFTGTFDGNSTHYVISDLTIDRGDENDVGLFGVLGEGALVEAVDLEAVEVTGSQNVGALVGANAGEVNESTVTGDVSGDSGVGGLVGNNSGDVTDSSASADVVGSESVGGLVGSSDGEVDGSSVVRDETGDVEVDGTTAVGGLIGTNDGELTDSSVDNVTVDGTTAVGGLLGANDGTVSGTTVDNATIDGGTEVGGFAGNNTGTISDSHAATKQEHPTPITIRGDDDVGGFVGSNVGKIDTSSATGNVTNNGGTIGGFVGYNEGNVSESYVAGNVTGEDSTVGGLVGINEGNVTEAYIVGNITGDGGTLGGVIGHNEGLVLETYVAGGFEREGGADAGGLIGEQTNTGSINNSYWNEDDIDVPADRHIRHNQGGEIGDNVEKLTTTEMTGGLSIENMDGLDFDDTWIVQEGDQLEDESYPYLVNNEQVPPPPIDELPFAGGNGTAEAPYQIENWFHLNNVRGIPDAHYNLTADLHEGTDRYESYVNDPEDDEDEGFAPIGDAEGPFTGSFNGTGHSIADLIVDNATADDAGLFGVIGEDGHVGNVTLENATITGSENVGGLAGINHGTITNVSVTGEVTGSVSTGGLVGTNTGDVIWSAVVGNVSGDERTGGLLGVHEDGSVEESYAGGAVTGGDWTGGLIGNNTAAVTRSYAASNVTGDESVGGLFGLHATDGDVTGSYSASNVTGDALVGGLVGYEDGGTVENTYYDSHQASPVVWDYGNDEASSEWGLATAEMSGEAAPERMDGFDFDTTWLKEDEAGEDSYPLLRNNTQVPAPAIDDPFADGDGSAENPWEIEDWFHLDNVRANPGDHFELNTTLAAGTDGYDLVSENVAGFRPIGDNDAFTVTFNGSDHVIEDLVINRSSEDGVGLFGTTGEEALIERIALENATITGGEYVGGVVGDNSGTVAKSYVTGNVSGSSVAGGLVGTSDGLVTESYVTATVNGSDSGGLVGAVGTGGTVNESYAVGNVTGDATAGLVGTNDGEIEDAYWDVETTGQEAAVGGGDGSEAESVEGLLTPQLLGPLADETTNLDFEGTWDVVDDPDADGYNVSYPVLQDNRQDPEPGLQQLYAAGGDADPYEIEDWFHLYNLRAAPGADFVLTGDLDENTTGYSDRVADYNGGFDPIGAQYNGFNGTLDGDGHVIANLTIDRPTEDLVGLFGVTRADARIEALELRAVDVTGNESVGGLAGEVEELTLEDVWMSGDVSGNDSVGGLVGHAGEISATNTSMAGSVSGEDHVGGLIGTSEDGTIQESHATAAVTGNATVGGLVGDSNSLVIQSYATGTVEGNHSGGLVGTNRDEVADSYATGDVTGDSSGGLVGTNIEDSNVITSYATGAVDGDDSGGLVGTNQGTVDNSYWDVRTTGTEDAIGSDTDEGVENSAGLVTPQMLGAGADANMDFDFENTWQVSENGTVDGHEAGYPVLEDNAQDPAPGLQQLYAAGDGDDEPWEIDDWHHLDNVRANLDGEFVLTATLNETKDGYGDLVDTTEGFLPIAERHPEFTGTFDGDGHVIANLTIDRPSADEVGLFSSTGTGATIETLGVEAVDVTGNESVGALVGNNTGDVTDSFATGDVTGNESVGGLVGLNSDDGEVTDSSATIEVTGETSVGGLVGYNVGDVTGSDATSDVVGNESVGGLAGTSDGSVTGSSAAGPVTGNESVGGLVGTSAGPVTASSATGDVHTGDSEQVGSIGGLVGHSSDDVALSNATGEVHAADGDRVGGLVGLNTGDVTESYANSTVTGNESVGGLVGQNDASASVANSYAVGDVTAEGDVAGGLVGHNTGEVNTSYATGLVTAEDVAGGLVGDNDGKIDDAYWDVMTTTQQAGVGEGTSDTITGLDTPQMLGAGAEENMDALDFPDVWNVSEDPEAEGNPAGYPLLRNNVQDPPPGFQTLYAAGNGTADEPWEIESWSHLDNVRSNLDGNFELTGDLSASTDAESYERAVTAKDGGFLPIAAGSPEFTGTFDGNGSVIADLVIDRDRDEVGLFSATGEGALVEGVGLENVTITGIESVGGLVGANAGNVTDSSVAGDVTGTESVGGLVGTSSGGVNESHAESNVTGTESVGGLVGTSSGEVSTSEVDGADEISGDTSVGGLVGTSTGTVTASTVMDAVEGEVAVGGLVGTNDGDVIDSTAEGNVTGNEDVGGLVGSNDGDVIDSTATGLVEGINPATNVGGLVGYNTGDVVDSTASGEVDGETSVGGLVGHHADGSVENSTATDDETVTGTDSVGGLVGTNDGTVEGASAERNVTGTESVGGLAGTSDGTVTDSNATVEVAGDERIGGLVGYNTGDVTGSNATVEVDGETSVGGLVGVSEGAIADSNATGLVEGTTNVGGLVGLLDEDGTIDASNATVTVTGTDDVGGLVGHLAAGSITDSTAGDEVEAETNVGGLVGHLEAGSVTGATTHGEVNGTESVGGLVGLLDDDAGTIDASNATVTVTGTDDVGGLVGHLASGSITDSNVSGDVEAETNAGGLVGHFEDGTVQGSNAMGNVTGESADVSGNIMSGTTSTLSVTGGVGGLVGHLTGGSITDSTASGDVVAETNVGGLVGHIEGGDVTATAESNVTGEWQVGGLVGHLAGGSIDDSTAHGDVEGESRVGGLVGYIDADEDVKDVEATGNVTGESRVGGLVGHLESVAGTLDGAAATGDVTGDVGGAEDIGGLVGLLDLGTVESSAANGTVEGTTNVGGLVGHVADGTVEDSNADGTIEGTTNVGGLVGLLDEGTVTGTAESNVTGESQVGGFVGYVAAGSVAGEVYAGGNVTVDDGTDVGGLVGLYDSSEPVTDVAAGGNVTVSGATNVGGLVGHLTAGTVTDSTANTTVTATAGSENVSGLVGLLDSGETVTGVDADGTVTTEDATNVGGVVGHLATGTVEDSSAAGNVTADGSTSVGGLVGLLASGEAVTGVDATGDVTGDSQSVGGLVGTVSAGMVEDSSAVGAVEGSTSVGGLVGLYDSSEPLTRVEATGDVLGEGDVGGLVGHVSAGSVENASATGDVTADVNVGGLVGFLDTTESVVDVTAEGNVTGDENVGGLVGTLHDGFVRYSSADGAVTDVDAGENVGGLVGFNSGSVLGSNATGDVAADENVGGLVGTNDGAVTETNATGDVEGTTAVGGLVGHNAGGVTESYTEGNVTADSSTDIGGLVGHNTGLVSTSYVTGDVEASDATGVGGIAGTSDGTITDSYVTGDVDGHDNVGGLVGHLTGGTVNNTYTRSTVSGTGTVGGLVGTTNGEIGDSYWNATANDVGVGNGDGDGVTGLVNRQMQDASPAVYMAFDYNSTWDLTSESYPVLDWQDGPERLDSSSQPVVIDDEGAYQFHTAFDAGTTALEITSSDVQVDGNGHVITDAGASHGIHVHDGATNVTVGNLALLDWNGAEIEVGSDAYATADRLTFGDSEEADQPDTTVSFAGSAVRVGLVEFNQQEDAIDELPTNRAEIGRFVDVEAAGGEGRLDTLTLHYEEDDLMVDVSQVDEEDDSPADVNLVGLQDEELSMWEYEDDEWTERPRLTVDGFDLDDSVSVDPDSRTVTAESVTVEGDTMFGVIANGYFELNLQTDLPEEVFAVGDVNAVITVENRGEARGNQTIAFNTYGFDTDGVQDSERIVLDGRESQRIELNWVPTLDDIDPSPGTVILNSDDEFHWHDGLDVMDPEGFVVDIEDMEVTDDRILVVDVVVVNTNQTAEDTQEITVEVTGLSEDYTVSETITLEPGEETELRFEIPLGLADRGEANVRVGSVDTQLDQPLVVPPGPGYFDVSFSEEPPAQVQVGEQVSVEAVVENIGGEDTTQLVTLDVGDESSTSQIGLGPEEIEVISATWVPGEDDVGTHTAVIESHDERETVEFEVVPGPPAVPNFQVEILQVPGDVTVGDEIQLVAEVTNVGNGTATQTVLVDFEGIEPITQEVTLGPGENETLVFDWIVGEDIDEGDYEVVVETEDDRAGAVIGVSPREEVEEDDTDDGPSPVQEPATIISLTLLVLIVGGLVGYYYVRRRRLTRPDEEFYRDGEE